MASISPWPWASCGSGDVEAVAAAEDGAREAQERFDACARRIFKEPVRNQSDLMLLAEATYWCVYTHPAGLWAPEAEAQLAGKPPHVIKGIVEEAVLALLKGVRDIGMRAAFSMPDASTPNAIRANYLASDWHRIVTADHEAWDRPENADGRARDALHLALVSDTEAIWAKPVRTWDDLIVRAAIAVRWSLPCDLDEPAYPDCVINGPNEDFDRRASAHVVRGILDLAGLKFDAEGRLIEKRI
jgi:hypothetical protein